MGTGVATDLRQPVFRISFADAMPRRLRRNYIWIFLILLLAWVLKVVTVLPRPLDRNDCAVLDLQTALANASLGHMPGGLVLGMVAAFYGVMIGLSRRRLAAEDGTVHV